MSNLYPVTTFPSTRSARKPRQQVPTRRVLRAMLPEVPLDPPCQKEDEPPGPPMLQHVGLVPALPIQRDQVKLPSGMQRLTDTRYVHAKGIPERVDLGFLVERHPFAPAEGKPTGRVGAGDALSSG